MLRTIYHKATQRLLSCLALGVLLWSTGAVQAVQMEAASALIASNFGNTSDLSNNNRLPVVTAFSCLIGQFGFPGQDSVAEALLLPARTGAELLSGHPAAYPTTIMLHNLPKHSIRPPSKQANDPLVRQYSEHKNSMPGVVISVICSIFITLSVIRQRL